MVHDYTVIGDHIVKIACGTEWARGWFRRNCRTVPSNRFRSGKSASLEPDLMIEVEDGFGERFAGYDVRIRTEGEWTVYERNDYRIALNRQHRAAKIAVFDDFGLKHAMTNTYSAFIIHHQWGLLLHASAAHALGQAFLFAGPSGTGKSLAALFSAPRPVLSDEAALVKVSDGGIVVYDSPFRSDRSSLGDLGPFSLGAIYWLCQSDQVGTVLLNRSDAFTQLLGAIFYWEHDRTDTAKLFVLCRKLAEKVPFYRLADPLELRRANGLLYQ